MQGAPEVVCSEQKREDNVLDADPCESSLSATCTAPMLTYKQGDSYSEKYEILNLLYLAIYSHLAISQYATNSGKWGIPEKRYKNVAQQ